MTALFFNFFGSDPSKMDQTWSNLIKLDQTWSNWISHQSKNVIIKSCHIYRKDKSDCFIFDFFYQICPTWIKQDQIGSNWICHQSKTVTVKAGYPILFASNVFHNSHLIQRCIQNQQQLFLREKHSTQRG